MSDDKRETLDPAGEVPADEAATDAPSGDEDAQAETADAVDPVDTALALAQEVTELKDKLLRAMAEVENIRRRGAREKQDALKFGVADFARDICDVADNLTRAIDSAPADKADDPAVKSLLDGVRMTETALLATFSRHGITRLDPAGERFDPNQHEAMTEIETADQAPGTVAQVVQTGYRIHDRLLRPARVIVARAPKDAAPTVDTKV